ncbi:MAG: S46 family peptidase [Fimbriiglobus sp.]
MRGLLLLLLGVGIMGSAAGDEGMWLPNDPPKALLLEKYQYALTDEFVQKAMRASVRFPGASGGFVSPEGLVVTNHHVGSDAIQKLSTSERDLMKNGFVAKTRADELKCEDMELNVLDSIEDVTAQVNGAVKEGMKPAEAAAARRAMMSGLEKESFQKTKLKAEVVTLYQGGLYHLYRYKKYTDVRLVFAPESAIASFGGDVDNFEYPRTSLDCALFRAYENGEPAKTPHFFRWSAAGPKPGDLVFVTGHPGTTNRLETLAKLRHRRDETLPYDLARLRAYEAALIQFSEQSPENRRLALNTLHSVANRRKAFAGQYQGLLDPKILAQKATQETELIAKASNSDAWDKVAKAQETFKTVEQSYYLFERGDAFFSDLFPIAKHCYRMRTELKKPNADRLREYRDSNLESLKLVLFSPAPISPVLERTRLQTSLTFMVERLGVEHPLVVKVLAGKNPAERASQLIAGTNLFHPEARKGIINNGDETFDTLYGLMEIIDGEARRLRKIYEDEVDEAEKQGYAEISKVRFAAFGKSIAPDATFTLRLAYGMVKDYEVDGNKLQSNTTFADAYERAQMQGQREPFEMPKRWLDKQPSAKMVTPFNFVSTADTIGGNSGSPVLNRDGELVGINFDRNRHGLVRNFVYTEVQARHIAVHSAAVIEALRAIYDAPHLVSELLGEKK